MKYKIEIWQYQDITATYESDNIQDILSWYRSNWYHSYVMGFCSFSVHENERELSFEEEYEFGFYN